MNQICRKHAILGVNGKHGTSLAGRIEPRVDRCRHRATDCYFNARLSLQAMARRHSATSVTGMENEYSACCTQTLHLTILQHPKLVDDMQSHVPVVVESRGFVHVDSSKQVRGYEHTLGPNKQS